MRKDRRAERRERGKGQDKRRGEDQGGEGEKFLKKREGEEEF